MFSGNKRLAAHSVQELFTDVADDDLYGLSASPHALALPAPPTAKKAKSYTEEELAKIH